MTGTTTNGLPYPENDDPVNLGAAAIQALAEALDAGVIGAWANWTIDATHVVAAANWTIQSARFRNLAGGAVRAVDIAATRTGSALVFGSDGNVADTDVATGLNSAPWTALGTNGYFWADFNGASVMRCRIDTAGKLTITSGMPTYSLAVGSQVHFTDTLIVL